jgi:ABC-type transport system substrate-binding protein
MVTVASVLASACSGSSGQSTDSSSNSSADVDPNGTLTLAAVLNNTGGAHLDPAQSDQHLDDNWLTLIYGTLLKAQPNGTIVPFMAQSYDIVNPTTISLKLRPGVKFTDGTPYDATAVSKGLMRNLNPPFPSSASTAVIANHDPAFDQLKSVKIDNSLEVTITLKAAVAGQFLYSLANPEEGSIVSPTAAAKPNLNLNTDPVGAGPYKLKSFVPDQSITLVKNDSFFDSKDWRLGGVDFVQTLPGPTETTALLSGEVDMGQVQAGDVGNIKANSQYTLKPIVSQQDYSYLNICTTQPPFNNPKVRQAISLAINRQQLIDLWQSGQAQPQLTFWQTGSPNYNPEVANYVKYDLSEAKSLIAQSGEKNISFNMYWSVSQPYSQASQIIQEQLSQIGVKVNIIASQNTVSEFIQPQKPGAQLAAASRLAPAQIAAVLGGGLITLCGAKFPQVTSLLQAAAQYSPTSSQAAAYYKQLDLLVAQNTWTIFLTTQPEYWTWSNSVIGGSPQFSPLNGEPDFSTFYIKKS